MSAQEPVEEAGLPAETHHLISLGDHPRVAARVRRAKAWGGLVAFGIVVLGSTSHWATLSDALLRGLVAGVIGLHVTWVAAVIVARWILKARTVVAVEEALERNARARAARP